MPNPKTKETAAKPKRKLSKKRLILLLALAFILLIAGTAVGMVVSIASKVPPFDPNRLADIDQTSIIYDKDGNQIGLLHAKENREEVKFEQIPESVKKAFITVEDIRFEDHFGVDPQGIMRALYKIVKGDKIEGGSTITIQLARNAFLSQEQTLARKIQEAVLAMKLERLYTKDEILTFYLNRIFFGESAYGIKAAAKTYFGKDITSKDPKDQLTIAEVALLAGLPQAPTAYDPYINPDKAKYRRTVVLQVLRDNNVISQEEFDKAKEEPFTYVEKMQEENKNPQAENLPRLEISYKFPYFVDYVIDELQNNYGISNDKIFSGGLKIYTTVDSKIQAAAEKEYANPSNFPANVNGKPVESAMVIMDPKEGAIRAMVGGRNYRTARDLNRAYQSKRQPGSTFKPLVAYTPALAKGGYFEGTVLDDMPVSYKGGDGKNWTPTDFDSGPAWGWRGLITMREGLRNSVNIYAIKLLDQIGIDYGWEFAKDKFGIELQDKDKVLSLALGTAGVRVVDMVSAYTAFPNGGVKAEKHAVVKVLDNNGNVLVDNSHVEKKRIFSEQVAYLMNDMLHNVVQSGTGTKFKRGMGNWVLAGKTGTTSLADNKKGVGLRDAWFVGYSPLYVGAVWMGLDQSDVKNHLRSDEYGGNRPALLLNKIFQVAHAGQKVISSYPRPSGISYITYDTKSGLTPSSLTPSKFISNALAISGALPSGTSDVWTEMEVCANDGLLPGPNTKNTVTKVFLNVKRDGIAAKAAWPKDEAPYKPPTQVCSEGPGPGPGDSDLDVKINNVKVEPGSSPGRYIVTLSVKVKGPAMLKGDITGPKGYPTQTWTTKGDLLDGDKIVPIQIDVPKNVFGEFTITAIPFDLNAPEKTGSPDSAKFTIKRP